MKMMVERDSDAGKKRVGGRENKDNLEGEKPMNNFKRKHRLKECKCFAKVGWILEYGLRIREEKGGRVGKRKQLRIELAKTERVEST